MFADPRGGRSDRSPATRTETDAILTQQSLGLSAHVSEPDHASAARAIALRLLTAAPRSRAQLAAAMGRKGIPEPVIDQVLDRFSEVGLINDAVLAVDLVTSRHKSRGLIGTALRADLRRRGIPQDMAETAVAGLGTEEIDSTARALVARKLAQTRGLKPEVRMRRTMAMLTRKGYQPGLVAELIRAHLLSEGADPSSLDDCR